MEVRNHVQDVCLIESAPGNTFLSRLVNFQPLTNSQVKVKSYPLDQIKNHRVQESLVVRDLLLVLVGLEGVYIRYNNSYDPRIGSEDEIRGPDFKIAKNMDPSLKSFAKWIVKFGKIYVVLTRFSERFTDPVYGAVLHRLCFEIRQFLSNEYMRCIVETAETEFETNTQFSIRELGQLLTQNCVFKAQLLHELVQEIMQEMNRRAMMDREEADFQNFIQDLRKEKETVQSSVRSDRTTSVLFMTDSRINLHARGGVILQLVEDKLKSNWGNQRNVDFLQNLFWNISAQYCTMLEKWLTNGSLEDPYDEFMVSDTTKAAPNQTSVALNSLNSERLWDTQYVIRKDGLMNQLNSGDVAFKILMTGKLLNLFRTCCNLQGLDGVWPLGNSGPLTKLPQGTQLTLYVDVHYERANKLAWSLFYEGYNLPRALQEIHQNFLLYNIPTFFRKFFNRSLVELTKVRSDAVQEKLQVSFQEYQKSRCEEPHNVILPLLNLQLDKRTFYRIIEQFSSETTSEKDNADLLQARDFGNLRDMLLQNLNMQDRNETTASQSKESQYSVHHLQFEILVPFPLNTLVSKTCVVQYQMIQRYLLLLHYYNKILQDTWLEINKNKVWRHAGFGMNVKRWIRRCRVVHFRMAQFMKFMLEYTSQDVIQGGWVTLEPQLRNSRAAGFDYYHSQAALQDFLTQLMSHSLLTNASLVRLLIQITDIVHRFCKFVTSLRKTLCLLDIRLFSSYQAQLPDGDQYDEQMALQKLQELQDYLDLIWDSFTQHRNAFAEGVFYYCDHGSVRSGENPVLYLVERLKSLE
ncbi:LANO_0C08130g1_1 [Lachancea nothofagi CBS 11611]|uniref:Spindle pole body component n=1 Tax=Lachancea nothofagi CBS 11611 TaxID=1266666 RepID=A0A1G4J925_9SACH|nr:LANO_0C08130g1_1 [Lachancea nothofagi CBS 11611]